MRQQPRPQRCRDDEVRRRRARGREVRPAAEREGPSLRGVAGKRAHGAERVDARAPLFERELPRAQRQQHPSSDAADALDADDPPARRGAPWHREDRSGAAPGAAPVTRVVAIIDGAAQAVRGGSVKTQDDLVGLHQRRQRVELQGVVEPRRGRLAVRRRDTSDGCGVGPRKHLRRRRREERRAANHHRSCGPRARPEGAQRRAPGVVEAHGHQARTERRRHQPAKPRAAVELGHREQRDDGEHEARAGASLGRAKRCPREACGGRRRRDDARHPAEQQRRGARIGRHRERREHARADGHERRHEPLPVPRERERRTDGRGDQREGPEGQGVHRLLRRRHHRQRRRAGPEHAGAARAHADTGSPRSTASWANIVASAQGTGWGRRAS